MRYVPSDAPLSAPRALRRWLRSELGRVAAAFVGVDSVTLSVRSAAPARIEDGMVVYADGANWNPGAGAGVYAREAGAWVKL